VSSALWIGCFGFVSLFGLIILKVPIGISMIIVGLCGFAWQMGWAPALSLLAGDPAAYLGSVDLAAIPLFLLMGTFASTAGFSSDIYAVASGFLGHRRGGLAYASVGGCAAFGCVCGSSLATAATFAKVSLPEMLRRGYEPGFAAGSIAAGGALKNLIPPSLIMILYCVITNTFILDLFAAAVVPALLMVLFNIATIALYARFVAGAAPVSERVPWAERLQAIRRALPAFILIAAVFGGLYSGTFTVNEAASVAAVLALIFTLLRGRLNWSFVSQGLLEAASVTAMVYTILFGAAVFTYFMNLAGVPAALVGVVEGMKLSPIMTIIALMIVYLILGTIFDELSAVVITLPFVLPIVVSAGYDPIWWGVIMAIQIELALIHPPLGILVFLLHRMAPSIPIGTIYRGVAPFIVADLLVLIILIVAPEIALWLPHAIAK
jgi:tripartite ATP-independent transporter DctM subunit